MTILEIINAEAENKKGIILHREGLFWRAYEQSAYRFFKYVKTYKATKKQFKGAKKELIYLGFPHNKLEDILKRNGSKQINKTDRVIEITEFETDYDDFIKWKNGIEILATDFNEVSEKADFTEYKSEIIHKIKRFPVMNKTPLECQLFLNEIQNQINGYYSAWGFIFIANANAVGVTFS